MGNYNEHYKKYYRGMTRKNNEGKNYGGSHEYVPKSINRRSNTISYIDIFMKQTMVVVGLIVIATLPGYLKGEIGQSIKGTYDKCVVSWKVFNVENGGNLLNLEDKIIRSIDFGIGKLGNKKGVFKTMEDEFLIPSKGNPQVEYIRDNGGVVIINKVLGEVVGAYDGTVEEVKKSDNGYVVVIDHGDGVQTKYENLSKVFVKEGDSVQRGKIFAYAGRLDNFEGYRFLFRLYYMEEEKDVKKYLGVSST